MVPLFIGTYSVCTRGSVLMKMCCAVDSNELSTGIGGGAIGSEVMCCNSMLVYVAILQPEKKLRGEVTVSVSSTLCTHGVKYHP